MLLSSLDIIKKKRQNFVQKPCVHTICNSVFSVCSFAHLLCVHIVFEQNFVFPFFFIPSHLHCWSAAHHHLQHRWTERHSAYGTTELCSNNYYYFVQKSDNLNVPGVKFLDEINR